MNKLGKLMTHNAAGILSTASAVGVVVSVIYGIRVAPVYSARCFERSVDLDTELTLRDRVEIAVPVFGPVALTTALSIGGIFAAHHVNRQTQATLAALLFGSQTMLARYQEALETVPPEVREQVQEAVAKSSIAPLTEANFETPKEPGDHLVFDAFSGRYFRSDAETIKKAVNEFNSILVQTGEQDVNLLYELLGLAPVQLGVISMGWTSKELMTIQFGGTVNEENIPVLVLQFRTQPKLLYR
jgi:hypothetical protein